MKDKLTSATTLSMASPSAPESLSLGPSIPTELGAVRMRVNSDNKTATNIYIYMCVCVCIYIYTHNIRTYLYRSIVRVESGLGDG